MLARCLFALWLAGLLVLYTGGCNYRPVQETVHRVEVIQGPTPIPSGNAQAAGDLTVTNGLFAVSFAVETAAPWGVARGGILDIGIIKNGTIGTDFVSLVDYMPNRWSAWPTTYQTIAVEESGPERAIIRVQRDWGEVELDTRFEITAGSSLVRMHTVAEHRGESDLGLLRSGYVAWPNGGTKFGMPGLSPTMIDSPDHPDGVADTAALAKWSVAYGAEWTLGLHTPFSTVVDYGGRDRYLELTLVPGASLEFEGWVEIGGTADLAQIARTDIALRDLPSGRISGSVQSITGAVPGEPAIVAMQSGQVFAWTLPREGEYQFDLPVGEYELYATARGRTRGKSVAVNVGDGADIQLNFSDVDKAAELDLEVVTEDTGAPLDAVVEVTGETRPVIAYFGRERSFTELQPVGKLKLAVPAGKHRMRVYAGAGFTSQVKELSLTLLPGENRKVRVEVPVLAEPGNSGWYNADLHHHSDVLDGFTPPEYVLRSELAAGVDLSFLSDHDSTAGNMEMARLSAERGIPFIGGMEMSPSWAHFNVYPLKPAESVAIEVDKASVLDIFAEARRIGASVIQANHPYNSNYGYLHSRILDDGTGNVIPGGYQAGYDLLEIEVSAARNEQTMRSAWQLWNAGQRVYLSAGSDVHDVWFDPFLSGTAKSFVYLDAAPAVETFVAALKQGHSYASMGPLIYPEQLFGTELAHTAGDTLDLRYRIQAVNGLGSVQLIERGDVVDRREFAPGGIEPADEVEIVFSVLPQRDTWYSLVVEDIQGKKAYSNPLWVDIKK